MTRQLLRSTALLAASSSFLLVTTAVAQVVINEIDVDQPSTDAAEFIELKNTGTTSVNLDAYTIELINGSGGAIYTTIDLPDVILPAGDYYVICANAGTVINCDLDVSPDTNLIQNGAPDGLVLKLSGSVIDAVSYEGDTAGATEGSGIGLMDDGLSAEQGLSRFPDGVDTNVNNVDLSVRCVTPGAANTALSGGCDQPVAVQPATWQAVKVLYR
jgi:hypothetical protein